MKKKAAYEVAEEMSTFRERDSRRSERWTNAFHPFFHPNPQTYSHTHPPPTTQFCIGPPDVEDRHYIHCIYIYFVCIYI